MLKFLTQRPIAVLTVFSGLLILGLVVLQQLPISLLPEIPIPQITVQISQPNTAVSALEATVVRPLRNQLLQVGNLKDIKSRSRNNAATILLEFDFGTNTNLAFIEVNEKIDQIMGNLPKDLPRPQVLKANAADIPIFQLSIFPKDQQRQSPLELAQFSQTVIKRRIEQLTQVAFVDRNGFATPEIQVIPNKDLLESLNLRTENLIQILQNNNLALGSILVQDGQYQYNIRFLSALQSVEDIANIYFNHEGRVLQLKDIVVVQLRSQQRRGKYLYNGQEAIVLSVRKQADAQLFALKTEFNQLLTAFRADYPELNFEVTNDQSELLEVSINNLRSSLLYGAFFAFIILFLFFWEWQAPLLIGLVIPCSLVIAILGFYLAGLSINIISLSGLILGVGLMIDNSIIVIENIRQYRKMGYAVSEAAVIGANEVIRPLVSSALTTCSVFLPLIFLSGIGGALFYDQALSISIALGTSLVVAYILLPTLLRLIGSRKKGNAPNLSLPQPPPTGEIVDAEQQSFYTKTVDIVLNYKWLTLLLFGLFTIGAFYQLSKMQQATFPKLSRQALMVKIDWNEAINLATNEKRTKELLDFVATHTTKSTWSIGEHQFLLRQENQGINESEIIIYTEDALTELTIFIRDFFQANYARATIDIQPLKNLFDELFGGNEALLTVHIQAAATQEVPSLESVEPVFEYLTEKGIFHSLPPQEALYTVQILKEQALLFQVEYDAIYQQLKTIFSQNRAGVLRTSEAFIPLTIGQESGTLYQLIQNAVVYNRQGNALPLADFVTLQQVAGYKTIHAGKTGEALPIALDTFSTQLVVDLKSEVGKKHNLLLSFTGQVFENEQRIKELSVILGIVLLLLYLILAAQFESLILPFIVMLTVPIGIGGALLLLLWTNQSINLIAIIGMIVMSGIVVNDAILKVDMMEKERLRHSLRAAIHIAGKRRLKPIIMTSLTTILALLPILFSVGLGAELQQPLAYAIIGGLMVGTLASLYFIPILYTILTKQKMS
ncbi:MAG: efflux RND transporter permease subunit [Saprospiraceae bacterium]